MGEERALARVSQSICATRYYDAPRPQGQASEIFQPSKASPTCGGDGAGRFDMCRGVSEGEQPPSHSLVREKQQRLIRQTTGLHMPVLPSPRLTHNVYARARTHVRKGCVDAICTGTRNSSIAGETPKFAHKLPLPREQQQQQQQHSIAK